MIVAVVITVVVVTIVVVVAAAVAAAVAAVVVFYTGWRTTTTNIIEPGTALLTFSSNAFSTIWISICLHLNPQINAADPLQLRHGDDGCAEVFPAPV